MVSDVEMDSRRIPILNLLALDDKYKHKDLDDFMLDRP